MRIDIFIFYCHEHESDVNMHGWLAGSNELIWLKKESHSVINESAVKARRYLSKSKDAKIRDCNFLAKRLLSD